MMTKKQALDYAIGNNLWVAKRMELESILDQYAQSIAKEAIEELSNQDPMLSRASTIGLIKHKFNLI